MTRSGHVHRLSWVALLMIECSLVSVPSAWAQTPKTFLITGASSGFGRATAERLAAAGHHVYAGARKQEDLDALGALENVTAVRLDVNAQTEVDAVVEKIKADGRKLDGLVNNAGVAILFPLNETTEDDLRHVIDTNVIGPWRVTKACAPLLIETKGRVVNLSSISGIFGGPLLGPYAMSKHAVEAYTESLRGEMAQSGVTVCAIEPGNFATGIGQMAFDRMKAKGQTYEDSPFEEAAKTNMERLRRPDGKEDPDRVVDAIVAALLEPEPKPRSLVVSNQRDAEVSFQSHIRKLAQLNEGHEFSYTRDQLVAMLDTALAEVGGASDAGPAGKVTGTASYRERMALLPGAELRVQLVDVSRADAPAVLISEQVISLGDQQVPISFELIFDPAKIIPNHTYAVQASIGMKDALAFRTDQRYEVITRGAPHKVELLLKRIQNQRDK